MQELINEYRNLLWGAVFLLIAGSYSFTMLGILYLSKQADQTFAHTVALSNDINAIRDRQTRAIAIGEAEHKRLENEIERIHRGGK